MKNTKTRRRSHLFINNRGFISVFFLGVLIYISALLTVVIENENARMKAMLNLDINNRQFLAEAKAISAIKCQLQQEKQRRETVKEEYDDEEDYDDEKENAFTSGVIIEIVTDPYVAVLRVTYDPRTLEILDYETARDIDEIMY